MFDGIVKKLAKKYNLDQRIVREICMSPFRFGANHIREADIKPIKYTYLFKIKPKKNCLTKLEEHRNLINDSKSKETE